MLSHTFRSFVVLVVLAGIPGHAFGTGTPVKEFDPVNTLAEVKKSFLSVLTTELVKGPENALNACKLKASAIPAQFDSKSVKIGRTTEKPRNPNNAPGAWMESFLKQGAKTTADAPLKPVTLTLEDGYKAYMEPIYVGPMCVTCHGAALDQSLKKKINELYPDDKATGYQPKDFRGAFWVKWKP